MLILHHLQLIHLKLFCHVWNNELILGGCYVVYNIPTFCGQILLDYHKKNLSSQNAALLEILSDALVDYFQK